MKTLALTIVALNYISFCWSVIGLFRPKGGLVFSKYRILQLATLAFWCWSFWKLIGAENTPTEYACVAGIQAVCLAIFWIHTSIIKKHNFGLVFSKTPSDHLVQKGLYRWIRNPFYLTYLSSYSAAAFLVRDPACVVLLIVLLAVYVQAARDEEKQFLEGNLQSEYASYLNRTGRFLPKFIITKKSA